jgi:hypothetical protein
LKVLAPIDYSQVRQWYPHFEKAIGDPDRWELLWNGGAGVDKWSDPNYAGWGNPPVSPCKERSDDPDRVVLSACPSPKGGAAFRASRQHPKIEEAIARVAKEAKP